MGDMRTYGSATEAPKYNGNFGTPAWSGLHESEFTDADALVMELREFIKFEATRQGYNDSAQNRIGENVQFFHDAFLGGWPQRLWSECYQRGVKEQQDPPETPPWDEVWPSMPI